MTDEQKINVIDELSRVAMLAILGHLDLSVRELAARDDEFQMTGIALGKLVGTFAAIANDPGRLVDAVGRVATLTVTALASIEASGYGDAGRMN